MNKQIQTILNSCGPGSIWETSGNVPVTNETAETASEFISEQAIMCNSLIDAIALPDGKIELEIGGEDDTYEIYDVSGNTVEVRQGA